MTGATSRRIRVPLTQGKWALVSPEDVQAANGRPWYAAEYTKAPGRYFAAARGPDGGVVYLHRIIAERMLGHPIPQDMCVWHINGNRLDNRRENILVVTRSQVNALTPPSDRDETGFKGVYKAPRTFRGKARPPRYRARCAGRYLGTFDTPQEAARAYDKAAIETYGAGKCYLNFPDAHQGGKE